MESAMDSGIAAPSEQRAEGTNHGQSFKIVLFKLFVDELGKKLDYGVRIEQVQEIGTVGSLTRVPGAPSYVRGVMNLRGKIINIIDIKEKLGFKPIKDEHLQSARILVTQIENRLVGVLVDEVDQVLEVSYQELENASKVVPVNAKYFGGIAKHGERLIVLVELDEIFRLNHPTRSDSAHNQSGKASDSTIAHGQLAGSVTPTQQGGRR